jgi:hypothetical protein
MSHEDHRDELREEVTAADATGMIADEEFIARLHSVLPPEHAAHASIDALHAEANRRAPNRTSLEKHVNDLRLLPELEAIVVNWWDSPRTQRIIADLNQIGL